MLLNRFPWFWPQHQASGHRSRRHTFILEPILTPSPLGLGLGDDNFHPPISDDVVLETDLFATPLDNAEILDIELGQFVVDHTGVVAVEFLYDGQPSLDSEVGIFSLDGLPELDCGVVNNHNGCDLDNYARQALDRALSQTTQGHIVLSEVQGDRPTFSSLEHPPVSGSIRTVAMPPGTLFGLVVVPDATLEDALNWETFTEQRRPLFSILEANPDGGLHFVQWGDRPIIGIESTLGGDVIGDYRDLILRLGGATGNLLELDEVEPPESRSEDVRHLILRIINYVELEADEASTRSEISQVSEPGLVVAATEPSFKLLESAPEIHEAQAELAEFEAALVPTASSPFIMAADIEPGGVDDSRLDASVLTLTQPTYSPDAPTQILPSLTTDEDISERQPIKTKTAMAIASSDILLNAYATLNEEAHPKTSITQSPTPKTTPTEQLYSGIKEFRLPKMLGVNPNDFVSPNVLLSLMNQGLVVFVVAEKELILLIQHEMVVLVGAGKTLLMNAQDGVGLLISDSITWLIDLKNEVIGGVNGSVIYLLQFQQDIAFLISKTATGLVDLKDHEVMLLIHSNLVLIKEETVERLFKLAPQHNHDVTEPPEDSLGD